MNEPLLPPDPLERAACLGLLGFAAATQFSIAATGILLTITGLLWLAIVVRNRERIEVPSMFFPLALYAVLTLVSAAFSLKPDQPDRLQAAGRPAGRPDCLPAVARDA